MILHLYFSGQDSYYVHLDCFSYYRHSEIHFLTEFHSVVCHTNMFFLVRTYAVSVPGLFIWSYKLY